MQISEISLYDYVTINATWHYSHNEKQFNCNKQIARYSKHSKIQVEDFLNKNGCRNRIIKTVRHNVQNIEFYSCVCNFKCPLLSLYLEMHDLYKKGIMPYPGSFEDQPAQLIEIFSVLDALYYERNKKLTDAHEKALKSGDKRG